MLVVQQLPKSKIGAGLVCFASRNSPRLRASKPLVVLKLGLLACVLTVMTGCLESSTSLSSTKATSDSPRAPITKLGGRLSISPAALELGDIWLTQSHEVKLTVSNVSNENINIIDAISSCSCTNLEPRSFSLDAGASTEIVMTLDLSENYPASSFEKELAVDLAFVDARGLYDRFVVKATIQRPFLFPEGIPSLNVAEGGDQSQSIELFVQSHSGVISVACETPLRLSVRSSEDVNPNGRRFTIELRDPCVLGPVSETVTLVANVEDQRIRKEVVIHGNVTGLVDWSPKHIILSVGEKADELSEEVVTIRSTENGLFRITNVLFDKMMLDVTPEDDAFKDWCVERRVSVRTQASASFGSAQWNGDFIVNVECHDGSQFSLPVKVGVAKIRTFHGGMTP